jgi:hypothetical protein
LRALIENVETRTVTEDTKNERRSLKSVDIFTKRKSQPVEESDVDEASSANDDLASEELDPVGEDSPKLQSYLETRGEIVKWMEMPGNMKLLLEKKRGVFAKMALFLNVDTKSACNRYYSFMKKYEQAKSVSFYPLMF